MRERIAGGRLRRRMYPAGLKDVGAASAGQIPPWKVPEGDEALPAHETAAGVLRAPCGPGPRDGYVLRQLNEEERRRQLEEREQEQKHRVPIRRPRATVPPPPDTAIVEEPAAEASFRPPPLQVPAWQPRRRALTAAASFPVSKRHVGLNRGTALAAGFESAAIGKQPQEQNHRVYNFPKDMSGPLSSQVAATDSGAPLLRGRDRVRHLMERQQLAPQWGVTFES